MAFERHFGSQVLVASSSQRTLHDNPVPSTNNGTDFDTDMEKGEGFALDMDQDTPLFEDSSSKDEEAMDLDKELASAVGIDSVSLGSASADNDDDVRQVPFLKISSNADNMITQWAHLAAKCRRKQNNLYSCIRFCNFVNNHMSSCLQCKGKQSKNSSKDWIVDSGASQHFTFDINDFAEYTPLDLMGLRKSKLLDSIPSYTF
ncbi:hypothetical protein V5O48_013527 [Marasmius crinis-equi]|uniref:Uncharacterized protein n=1 Tax=Marasmius crinis-equi TaxID=585013 RepID=A0ABR3EZU5_9AGAR